MCSLITIPWAWPPNLIQFHSIGNKLIRVCIDRTWGGGTKNVRPLSVQFCSFSCSLSTKNFAKWYIIASPLWGLCHPRTPRRPPPPENPGIDVTQQPHELTSPGPIFSYPRQCHSELTRPFEPPSFWLFVPLRLRFFPLIFFFVFFTFVIVVVW